MKTKAMGLKIAALAIVVVIGAIIAVGLTYYSDNKTNYDVIKLIHDRQKRPNEFIDMDGQVGVTDVHNLGYILKDSKIELHYGVQVIDIPYRTLDDSDWMDALGTIGIKVYRRVNEETGKTEYRLTYWDETIQEWSKVY